MIDENKLPGTWRLFKTIWRDKKETLYPDNSNWTEYNMGPAGVLMHRGQFNGKISAPQTGKWQVEGNELLVYTSNKPYYNITTLTDKELVLKSLVSDTWYHYRKL